MQINGEGVDVAKREQTTTRRSAGSSQLTKCERRGWQVNVEVEMTSCPVLDLAHPSIVVQHGRA